MGIELIGSAPQQIVAMIMSFRVAHAHNKHVALNQQKATQNLDGTGNINKKQQNVI